MSQVELTYINPVDLQSYWDLIQPGLTAVKEYASDGWIEEDVYHFLKAGTSTLHLAYADKEYVGFVVLTPVQGYDCRKLHIWCGYNQGEKDVLELAISEIEKLAKSIGARKVTFASPRKWGRRLPDFRVSTTHYEKDVL